MVQGGDLLARRYRLIAPVGAGPASTVWSADDEQLQRRVAVKLVGPEPWCDAAATEPGDEKADGRLLRREARTVAQIDHPAAVDVYDYGQAIISGGRVVEFAVMPLLDGESVGARLAKAPLPWPEAVEVAAEVAGVLAASHRQGIVHQDVSAENVLLTSHGPRLLDFGIASLAGRRDRRTGYVGTPPYVAPERLRGAPALPESDVYALGVLLFEMLTGERPHPGVSWDDVEDADRLDDSHVPRLPRTLPRAVVALCRRCLAAAPPARPTAALVEETLRAALRHRRSGRARAPLIAGVTTAAALTAAATAIVMITSGGQDDDATPTDAHPTADSSQAPPEDPVSAALDAFHATLGAALEDGGVRPDVSHDLAQLATNLRWSEPDREHHLGDLRRALDARLREGALSRDVYDELSADLTDLAHTWSYRSRRDGQAG